MCSAYSLNSCGTEIGVSVRLSRFPHNTILDLCDFIGGQFEAGGAHIALCLLSVADTDDCCCDGGIL